MPIKLPRWLWIPLFLHTCLAGILCFVPLFHLLGFEYSFAIGLLTAITSPWIGAGVGRRYGRHTLETCLLALGCALLSLLPALVLISLNAIRIRNCNPWIGLLFFLLLPCCSSMYGSCLGLLIQRWTSRWMWYKQACLLIALPLLFLWMCLWQLYQHAPIFCFSHLWGYFPGSLYDEALPIEERLWFFRGGTCLQILGCIGLIALKERYQQLGTLRWMLAGLGLVLLQVYQVLMGQWAGFQFTTQHIQAHLPVTMEQNGIVLHMPAGTSLAKQQALLADHLFRLQQITTALQIDQHETIHSYIYANAQDKAHWMGGRHTMFAKPWLREIHIHGLEVPHPIMAHELIHAVAAELAPGPLHVTSRYGILVNMGIVEGLAQALTPEMDLLDSHHFSKALLQLSIAPPMEELFTTTGFWYAAPGPAYTLAGSFLRFLLTTYGAAPLKALYAHGDFAANYGRSLPELLIQWQTMLEQISLTEEELSITKERFRKTSMFARPCAREIATLQARAEIADPFEALQLHQHIARLLHHSPESELAVGRALRAIGDDDGVLQLTQDLLSSHMLSRAQAAMAHDLRVTTYWHMGDMVGATNSAEEGLAQSLTPAQKRLAWIRTWALHQEQASTIYRPLLAGELSNAESVWRLSQVHCQNPQETSVGYLLARQLYLVQAYEQACFLLNKYHHPYIPIEKERLRLAIDSCWRSNQPELTTQLQKAYAQLPLTSGEVAFAQDWEARLTFTEHATFLRQP